MTYTEFINDIITTRGQWNPPTDYWEGHHIIPKCLGGTGRTNQKHENIIRLTAAEHFTAHKLLVEAYSDNEKLAYAFWAMCSVSKAATICSAEDYEQARVARSKTIGKTVRVKLLGTSSDDSARQHHSEKQAGQNNGFFGKTHTEETRQKLAASGSKPVRYINTGEIFKSSYEAADKLGISRVLINNCCRGKQASTSGGMQFEYVNARDINYNLPKNHLTKYDRRRIILQLRKFVLNLSEQYPDILSNEDKDRIAKLATCENRRYLLSLLYIFEQDNLLTDEICEFIKEL